MLWVFYHRGHELFIWSANESEEKRKESKRGDIKCCQSIGREIRGLYNILGRIIAEK